MPVFDVCGVNYQYPNVGDNPWGIVHIAWASAVSSCLTALNTQVAPIFPVGAIGDFLTVNGSNLPDWVPLPAATDVQRGTLSYYQAETSGALTTTFTWDGTGTPGTSPAVVLYAVRVGQLITLRINSILATTGTNSNTMTSNTVLPSWLWPVSNDVFTLVSVDNNALVSQAPGKLQITTLGVMTLGYIDGQNFFDNASAGMNQNYTVSYVGV